MTGNREVTERVPLSPPRASRSSDGDVCPGQGPSGWQQPLSCGAEGQHPTRTDPVRGARAGPRLSFLVGRTGMRAAPCGGRVQGEKALGTFYRKPGTPCPSQTSPETGWSSTATFLLTWLALPINVQIVHVLGGSHKDRLKTAQGNPRWETGKTGSAGGSLTSTHPALRPQPQETLSLPPAPHFAPIHWWLRSWGQNRHLCLEACGGTLRLVPFTDY